MFLFSSAQAAVTSISLNNGTVALEITPDIGGRVLSVGLVNQPNFLLVGDAVENNPNPLVTPQAENIGYLGHEVWVGPQSQWWIHQLVNPERKAAKSVWPPDPFLVLSKYAVQEQSDQQIIIQSPNSSISGVALQKRVSLVKENPNQIRLDVSAQNIRDSSVAWDIWFNTRVPHTTNVYVPVANMNDVRVANFVDETYGPLTHNFSDGIFALENLLSNSHQGRKGKVFIQPSQGWMAAFRDQQLLIIQFDLQPKTAIHPEQGQIELYQEFLNGELTNGLLELEVHAPYKNLKPRETMSATEVWTLLPYTGENSAAEHKAFLRELLDKKILR
ncbi:DUF4380 domain-containing protein [Cellvibrio sp. NN19]|uniref:DUF4380 domain-containing protein n=1 Tax=Cellvibrio chitinivorans TaxID=3102792 RepID=UPI002B41382A|nr:DUF4380 domain-containing protein [Cellvibrio sp. NN19]